MISLGINRNMKKSVADRVGQMQLLQEEQLDTFRRKNADYGDSFAKHGPVGVLIRISDKLDRMESITKSGVTLVASEGIRDTAMDLANYALMLVMLIDEGEERW